MAKKRGKLAKHSRKARQLASGSQREVWNALAEQWHQFRQKPFPDVAKKIDAFATGWKPGKILEVGCGNCRNLVMFAKNRFQCFGIDFSLAMLDWAKEYITKQKISVNLKRAEAEKLPFPDEFFEYELSIAVLHHLETEDARQQAVLEMKRTLKPGGKAVITVWNKLQSKFLFKAKDMFIPWTVKGKKYQRYYHLFTRWELSKLLKNSGFRILKANTLGKNLIFEVQKPQAA